MLGSKRIGDAISVRLAHVQWNANTFEPWLRIVNQQLGRLQGPKQPQYQVTLICSAKYVCTQTPGYTVIINNTQQLLEKKKKSKKEKRG